MTARWRTSIHRALLAVPMETADSREGRSNRIARRPSFLKKFGVYSQLKAGAHKGEQAQADASCGGRAGTFYAFKKTRESLYWPVELGSPSICRT